MALSESRARGAVLGSFIGDALAMPVHWYYDREALRRDYGAVRDYLSPKNPHPDSILWRSSYTPANAEADILHDQARYWGRRGVHYHQFLEAGENTLNLKLCSLLVDSLRDRGDYDADDWLDRFVAFLTTPGSHRDTYAEEYLRGFFENRARGKDLRSCGVEEKHIGGLAPVTPIVAFLASEPERARAAVREHVGITHPGRKMQAAADLLVDLLLPVLGGAGLHETIEAAVDRQASPFLGHSFRKWLPLPDNDVIGRHLSSACYVEDSVPAVIYLAMKYHDDLEEGLVANTMAGGDNVHRGAVLGGLLGAAHGEEGLPERWRSGLRHPPRY